MTETLVFLAGLVIRGMERRGIRLCGWSGRIWVYLWVLLPVPLLFHGPFLRGIVLPLL